MLKVSFKEDFKKVQVFNDKVTEVTLIGIVDLPEELWKMAPESISDWMFKHSSVDVQWEVFGYGLRLELLGKSKVHDDDTFDAVLGERIAESRAKIRLYKFMHTLTKKFMHHYFKILYGVPEGKGELCTAVNSGLKGGLQEACKKYAELWIKESQHLNKLINQV